MSDLTRREMLRRLSIGGATAGLGFLAESGFAEKMAEGDAAGASLKAVQVGDRHDALSATLAGDRVVQPARDLPVFRRTDVVVVGGGPAGFAAAVAAARTGAKVALVERYGSLGGLFTNGMVLCIQGTGVKEGEAYTRVTRGISGEYMDRLAKMGAHCIKGNNDPVADPEAGKILMDRMVLEAGVELFYHAWGVDVVKVGNEVRGVVFESKQGRQAILAKVVVDTTGDGDIFHQAGAGYRQMQHSIGYVYRTANVDRVDLNKFPVDEKTKKRKAPRLGGAEPQKGVRWTNCRGTVGNGLDICDLTKAELQHREGAWNYVEKMRGTAGCEEVFLVQTCSQVGTRATRLLEGVDFVDRARAKAKQDFTNAVAVSGDPRYIGPAFGIPYGALVPKTVDNLLTAGRCISCTPDIIDIVRLIAPCMVTGHAAGTAAALAAKSNVAPRKVPVPELQKVLREQGAFLG